MDLISCKKCKSANIVKAGFVHQKQRYMCRLCKCYFLPGQRTYIDEEKKMEMVEFYLEGMSIRGIGRRLKVSHVSVIHCLKAMAEKLRPCTPSKATFIE